MRRGVRLGIDIGEVRIGVARSDPSGLLASPAEVIRVDEAAGRDGIEEVAVLVAAESAIEVVVGLPIGLSGRRGTAAAKARAYAEGLVGRLGAGVPVRLIDERFSTVSAHRAYRSRGESTRRTRGRIDAAAAAVILQAALDSERATGEPAGEVVVV